MKTKADQASTLRKLVSAESDTTAAITQGVHTPRVIAVTSGKGGVGKSNIVSNLAFILSKMGKRVFILDADMGLANIDVLLGLAPAYNFQHVFRGEKSLAEIIVDGPGGVKILPASSGVQELSELTQEQKLYLLSEFSALGQHIDVLLIDTGAGISSNVMYFNMAAQEKLVVVTPEPTSITDAYAIFIVMANNYAEYYFKLIVIEAKVEHEAKGLYYILHSVSMPYNVVLYVSEKEGIHRIFTGREPASRTRRCGRTPQRFSRCRDAG